MNASGSLDKICSTHMGLVMLRRFASCDSNGHASPSVLNDPSVHYITEVSNHIQTLQSCLSDTELLLAWIKDCPPADWLDATTTKSQDFQRLNSNSFTLILHSALDRSLLLTNQVLGLGLDPRQCLLRKVCGLLELTYPEVTNGLISLSDAVAHLTDARNHFAHRGKDRYVEHYSELTRTESIIGAFGCPRGGTPNLSELAHTHLMQSLANDRAKVEGAITNTFSALAHGYLQTLNALGGPPELTPAEIARASVVLNYFSGGPRPIFWDPLKND